MQRRPFGPTRLPVPVIGQGTWDLEKSDRQTAIDALREGIELGLTHLDTAEMYGQGRVEELVGEAIQGRRDQVFLASKVLPQNASYQGTLDACERSLQRLGTDHLDLYLLHWREDEPLEETFRAFQTLQQQGKIRLWGVSNFDVADLQDALAIVGEGQIACNQVLYHLDERAIEHRVLPWCESHQVAVVAYSPFAQGRFPLPPRRAGEVLMAIANHHQATPYQVALAFLTRHPQSFAIPKAAKPEHVRDNARLIQLSAEEIRQLDEAFPLGPLPQWLPTV